MDQRILGYLELPDTAEAVPPAVEPGNVADRNRLVAFFRERRDARALCELFEREAVRAPTPEEAADAYFALGENLRTLDLHQRALEMWQRALRLVPGHRAALAASREANLALGRYEAAQAVIDREVAVDPADARGHAERYAELGRKALEQPYRHRVARSCAEAALALDPSCIAARALLDAISALRNGWRDQVRHLQERAAKESDPRAAARLHLQVAALHASFDLGGDAEARVTEALRTVFRLWPAMPEALEFLERRHAERNDFQGLAAAWEQLVETTGAKEAQVDLLLRLAGLYEVRFADPARAFAARMRAARIDPTRTDAMEPVLEQLREERRWKELAELFELHLAAVPQAERQPELHLRLAEVYLEQLGDRSRARQHLERALALDPMSRRAEEMLVPLLPPLIAHPADDAGEARAEFLLLAAERNAAGEPAPSFLEEVAIEPVEIPIEEEELAASEAPAAAKAPAAEAPVESDADQPAVEAAGAAAVVPAPGSGEENPFAEASAEPAGESPVAEPSVASGGERPLAAEAAEESRDDGEREDGNRPDPAEPEPRGEEVEADVQAVEASQGQGSGAEGAEPERSAPRREEELERCARILADRPDDPETLAALEALLDDPVAAPRAAELLVAPLQRQGAHAKLCRVLEIRVDAVADPAVRVAELRRLAQIAGRDLRDPRRAFAALARAFRESPGDALLRSELRVAAGQGGLLDELADVMAEVAERLASTGPVPQAISVERELAELHEKRLSDPAGAAERYRRILALEPRHAESLRALHRLLPGLEAWRDLYEVCLALAAVVPDGREKLQLLREAASVAAERLGESALAAAALRRVAEAAPEREILRQLESLYRSAEAWEEAAWALERLAPEDGEAAFRLAGIRFDHLGDSEGALELVRTVVEGDPRRDDARALLRRIAFSEADCAGAAVEVLDRALEAIGDADGRIELREAVLDRTTDPEARRRLHEEIVALHERELGSAPLAFVAAARAFAESPAFEETLVRLSEATGSWEDLVGIFADASASRPGLLPRLARLHEEKLGRLDEAIETWREVLGREPEHVEALDALCRLYAATNRAEELVEALRRRAALAEGEQRRDLLMQAADTCSLALEDSDRAIAFCREALGLDPDCLPALQTLALYLREEADRSELIEVLDRLAALQEAGSDERIENRLRRAELLAASEREAESLADLALVLAERPAEPRAVAALEALVGRGVVAAARLLEPIYRAAGDLDRLLALLERQLAGAAVDERASLLAEMVAIRLAAGEVEAAWPLALARFAAAPGDAEALAQLAELAERVGAHDGLADALENAIAERPADRDLLVRLAMVQENPLRRLEEARATWERILAFDSRDVEALRSLRRLSEATGAGEMRREAALRLAALLPDEAVALLREAAIVAERDLASPEQAIADRFRLHEVAPSDEENRAALERLLAAAERWSELAALLEERREEPAVALRLAAVRRRLGEDEAALELYAAHVREPAARQALDGWVREGSDRAADALALLDPLLAEEGASDLRVELREILHAADPARVGLLDEIRSIHEEAGQAELAFVAACRHFARDAEAALPHVERLARATGGFAELAEILQVAAETDPARRAAWLARAARVHETELQDLPAALDAWKGALEAGAGDEALDALARLHRAAGDDASLAEVLVRRAESADRDLAYRLLLEAAEVAQRFDPERAASLWRRARQFEPAGGEALRALLAHVDDPAERVALLADRIAAEPGDAAARGERLRLLVMLGRDEEALDEARSLLAIDDPEGEAASTLRLLLEPEATRDGAAELLEPIARKGDDAALLARILEIRVAAAADRLPLLREIAGLRLSLGEPGAAFAAAREAFLRDPADEATLALLERAAADIEAWEALAETWEQVLEQGGPAFLRRRLAALQAEKLELVEEAIGSWRAVLAEHPDDPEALAALHDLFRATSRWDALHEVCIRLGTAEALREAARLAEEALGDLERAADDWQLLVEREPGDADAFRQLARLSNLLGRWESLALALEGLRRIGGEAFATASLSLAALRRDRFGDPDGALALIREILEADPADEPARAWLVGWAGENTSGAEAAFLLLDENLAAAGDAAARIELRERRLPAADPAERRLRLDEIRQLHEEALGQPALAFVAACRAFADGERGEELRAHLERLAEATGSHEELVVLYEEAAEAGGDDRDELLARIADLREGLGQPEAAFRAVLARFASHPEDEAVTERLLRLAEVANAWESLAGAFEAALAALPAADERSVALLRILAPIYRERLGRLDAAAAAWEQIAAARPADEEPLFRLDEIYRSSGDARALCSVLRRRAAREEAPTRRRELFFEMASMLEDPIGDREAAIAVYRELLAVDEADPEAFAHLTRLLGETGSWGELAALLEKQIERAAADGLEREARELRYRLGRILQQQVGDVARAVELFRQVLAEQPRHPATIAALGELATSPEPTHRAAAAEILAPIYAEERDWQRHVQMLDTLAEAAVDPAARAGIHRAAAAIYERELDAPEMAFLAAGRALDAAPDDPANLALLLHAAELSGDLDEELAAVLASCAEKAGEGRGELLRARARLLEKNGDPGARAAWSQVQVAIPDDAEALRALARLHGGAGDVDAQLEALRSLLAREEEISVRRDLLLEIAVLQEERKRDSVGAIATLRRLVELVPDDAEALLRLDVLCVQQERWIDLAEVLAREEQVAAQRGDLPARIEFLARLAHLRETRLLDREGAFALHQQILDLDPTHEPTRARLEAILGEEPENLEAMGALERAYRATGEAARLAEVLEARLAAVTNPERRRPVFLELAEIRARGQERHDLAFLTLSRAFREMPADPELWPLLWQEAQISEAADEWLALQEEAAERLAGRGELAALALHVAPICEGALADEDAAARWYERAGDAPEALLALERLHRTAERWPQLAGVLDRLAERESDPREKVNLLFRLGRLAEERLADPARAIEAYRRLLAVDPSHLPTLRALEPLLEEAGDPRSLYDALFAQRQALPEGSAWQRLALRLAEVAERIGDVDLAAAHYREVLTRNPRSEAAAAGLEALLEREARHQELAELLRFRLQSTVEPREIAAIHGRLGRLQAEALGDLEGAIRSYQAVLERDPRHRPSLEALRALHAARDEGEALATVLRRLVPLQDDAAGVKAIRLELAETLAALGRREEAIENGKRVLDLAPHDLLELQRTELLFRDLEAWTEVIRTMELQAPLLEADPDAVIDLWRAVARLWEERLGRRESAAAALERILERRQDEEAFAKLREIYSAVGDWRRYAQASDRFAAACDDLDRRVALLAEVAEIHDTRLGQREFGFARLGAAFELKPSDEALRARLAALADEGGMHEELAAVYESVIDLWESDPVVPTLLLELGRLQNEKLDEPGDAEASFRRALELEPGSPCALEALASLFAGRGGHEQLLSVLEQQLEATVEIDDQRAILHRIARVAEENLGDRDRAARALERALALDPAWEETREALAGLYRRAGRLGDLAGLLARSRDLAIDAAARYALQRRLATLLETELDDDEAARSAWALAHELDPARVEPLDALERLHLRHERWAELLRVYDRKIAITESADERCRLHLRQAGIHEEQLHNLGAAIDSLEAALATFPGHKVVLRELARLLRAAGSHARLAAVTEQLEAVLAGDPSATAERIELLVRLGELRRHALADAVGAEQAWRRALDLDAGAIGAIGALAALCEETGRWDEALDYLRRQAKLLGDVADALPIHLRIGRILADVKGDDAAAEASWRRALAIDAGYVPALGALRALYEARGDEAAFLDALTREARHTEDSTEKTRLWNRVGRFHFEHGDEDAAIRAWEEARRHTPDDLDASLALGERYFAREEWDRAEAALDVVLARLSPEGGPEEARRYAHQCYRLGAACERLEKNQKAVVVYGRAWELDPSLLSAGEGLARLLVRTGDDHQALRVYQAILVHHRDVLSDPEVVELHYAIGEIRRRLGDADAALKSFRAALELDAWHVDSHQAVIALAEAAGKFDLAVEHRQKLGQLLEGEEKRALLLDTAALAVERLADPWQAIDAYVAALRIRPDDLDTVEKLVALYRQTRQPARAVDLLRGLLARAEIAADPQLRLRCHVALGDLAVDAARTDPAAIASAVQHYNEALDLDWRQTAAFQAIESLLAERGEWRQLEANYVRMLQRLPREDATRPARVLLYRTLADLYRNVLQDPDAAAEAYKAVTVIDPDDGEAAARWAELVSARPGAELEAIAAWRKALPVASDVPAVARALERLHAKRRNFDAAFVAASVVTDLYGAGGVDESGIVARLRPFAKTQATGSLGQRQLLEIAAHEGLRGPVAQIFTLIHKQAGPLLSADFQAVPVQGRTIRIDRQRDRVDPTLYLAGALARAAASLGLEAPALYRIEGVVGLTVANTSPICLVAGPEMFAQQGSRRQLNFLLGRSLAFTCSELALARFHPENQLEALLQAAVLLGEPRFKRTADEAQVESIRRKLEQLLSPEARHALQRIAYGYARDRNRQSVRSYLVAAEHTANRVGALLCGDLAVARHQLAAEAGAAVQIPLEERIRDLAVFALSDAFGDLRKALGLAVQIPA